MHWSCAHTHRDWCAIHPLTNSGHHVDTKLTAIASLHCCERTYKPLIITSCVVVRNLGSRRAILLLGVGRAQRCRRCEVLDGLVVGRSRRRVFGALHILELRQDACLRITALVLHFKGLRGCCEWQLLRCWAGVLKLRHVNVFRERVGSVSS